MRICPLIGTEQCAVGVQLPESLRQADLPVLMSASSTRALGEGRSVGMALQHSMREYRPEGVAAAALTAGWEFRLVDLRSVWRRPSPAQYLSAARASTGTQQEKSFATPPRQGKALT